MNLNFGFTCKDLYERDKLLELQSKFLAYLRNRQMELANKYVISLENGDIADADLLDIAVYLQEFIAELFFVTDKLQELANREKQYDNLFKCKKLFIQKQAFRAYNLEEIAEFPIAEIKSKITSLIGEFNEVNFANYVVRHLDLAEKERLEPFLKYAAWSLHDLEAKKIHKDSVLFKLAKKLDSANLLEVKKEVVNDVLEIGSDEVRVRDGFSLSDKKTKSIEALNEANYCLFCHERDKDSCSKGLKDKDGGFKISDHKNILTGCPLEEKISEMNLLRAESKILAALAVAMIDNPLLAATGKRICNDCMKSCIYQKQDPVNIPMVETEILEKILELDYGFEIYSLLTRWNPLNIKRNITKPDSNKKILVVGQGPAGFNLAYHLIEEGHFVVAIEGLKVEPLSLELIGAEFKAIKNIKDLYEDLNERKSYGFGGVAEYGITVRWNKNFLTLIRIILERNNNYKLYGGVRYGSQITREIAFNELGFEHIALCQGAGSPNIITIKNNLCKGVRKASDFLMNLQSQNPYRLQSLANLQIRLPIIVIGGGLTAIDTATESFNYYKVQILKFYKEYQELVNIIGRKELEKEWDEEEGKIAKEFLEDAKKIKELEDKYGDEAKFKIFAYLVKKGGVKILYRKSLQDSPAYRLNHEEIEKAFEEGVKFVEYAEPKEIILDEFGAVKALQIAINSQIKTIEAKTILIAAGTKPNIVSAKEDKELELDGIYFKAIDAAGKKLSNLVNVKSDKYSVITYRDKKNRAISFFGDQHPVFAGNVVKAMASAKKGYPLISKELLNIESKILNKDEFIANLDELLIAKIVDVQEIAPKIIELIVKAPLAARNFKPGQFYRLQNFESEAICKNNKILATEPLALTGAWVDKEKGLVSVIILLMGGSSNFCTYLKKDEKIILMGPTGSPTKILANKNIMLVGGGLGNAVLFSIGKAFRDAGSKVLYFAGYKKGHDRYKIKEIEAAADQVIWACDENIIFKDVRKGDGFFVGNIVKAIKAYYDGDIAKKIMDINALDQIIAIGSDKMMAAIKNLRNDLLKNNPVEMVASVNSPMQCMMKEICAQCLQKHIDQETGEEYFVYSCANQDQNMDRVDFSHLDKRLSLNSLQEKLSKAIIKNLGA
ncbi:MAG: FAD-dependent oxidoreductase [Rickettsiales bacterium]|nr:FAD-dependent oxidoreductase [Rickettsiales bacterium]